MARGFSRGRADEAGVKRHAPRSLGDSPRPGSSCEWLVSLLGLARDGMHRMCQAMETTYRGVSWGVRPR